MSPSFQYYDPLPVIISRSMEDMKIEPENLRNKEWNDRKLVVPGSRQSTLLKGDLIK
jgi:hypothetical protein